MTCLSQDSYFRLTKESKQHIDRNWKGASVQNIVLRQSMRIIKDKNLIGKEVFIVEYPSSDNPTLGGYAVYADKKTHKIIGYGYRD